MDIRKLQRAIVNGLEDVKAQNIVVYNTEALSPLFERVIIASGTSNRQTKALAASVREAVKAAGAPVPRIEGEENGEWIIVDCGAAVAHIMQPAVRDYYRLEEIWGVKPVVLKSLARRPDVAGPRARQPSASAASVGAPAAPAKKATRTTSATKVSARAAGRQRQSVPRGAPASPPVQPAAKRGATAAKRVGASVAHGRPAPAARRTSAAPAKTVGTSRARTSSGGQSAKRPPGKAAGKTIRRR